MGDNITIDSIQIEIESSSTNAAKGIDALAGSLERLKKNGSFKTVSTNLNNLSTALKNLPNVHSAANSLRTLANSIEKLKSVGTVSSLSNSLSKLPVALKSVASIDLDKVAPRLQNVADAVAPLSSIKAGGLSTMVNSMKKLGEVTKSLDDDTIKKFTDKVELLSSKLTPLSQKMTSIKSGFATINAEAKKASKSVDELGDSIGDINASAVNLSSIIGIAETAIGVFNQIKEAFAQVISQAIEWDGIAARFGRGFGDSASETYAWIQRLNEEMGINIQEFMKYSSVYSTMLTGFGVASKDAGKMALGYMELTYDIWAGYNDVYRSLEETAEAVKSAIAGEVEPVRRAGFTIVEATLAQTAANHGLEISLANATEAQKSYLRYLTLMDQAHAQGLVGTYAKELNTAEGMMRTFAQQTKSLAQAFGSLFLPILVRVMPWLQAFVELLTEGVYWLANLLGVDIQPVDFSGYESGAGAIENVANSAGNATGALNDATKAAKELKNATLGFDELNIISPPSSSSSTGGGGAGGGAGGNGFAGLDVDSLWDETIFDTIQSDVDAIKEKLRGWMPVIAGVATALAGLRLVELLKDIRLIEATKFFTLKAKGFAGWLSAFTSLAKEGGIIATLAVAFPKLSKALKVFAGNFGAFFALAKEGGVLKALAAAFPKIANGISKVSSKFGWIGWIIAAVVAAISFLVENWKEMKEVAVNFFNENIAPKFEEIKKHVEKLKETLKPLKPVFEGVGKVVGWLRDAINWLIQAVGGLVVALTGAFTGSLFQSIVGFFEGLVQGISGLVQIIRGAIELIVGIVTGDGEKIKEAFAGIWAGIKDGFAGLYKSTIGVVVDLVQGVIGWFREMWDVLVGHSIVPDTINAIVDWFLSLPGKILGSVGDFVKGVVDKFANLGKSLSDKFSSAWESVKTWWSKKTDLSTYTPIIGNIASKLSSAWTSAKDWWNTKRSSLSYTPAIGKIWEKLKSAWTSAKDWWSKSRSNLSYTPSIGSISSKLSTAWTNAKNWWSKNRSSLSYTPSIGSIKDKIVSAWNSAKKWWSSNAKLSTKLNISVPKLTVNWGEVSALGKTFKYPKSFSVKFAADGGMFDAGSLIWAGERGAEIVANAAGGKTGVMNVQQMQDAVYEGVFSAMVAAMRGQNGGSGSQVVKVYIDGREVASSVEKAQRERGASIMGNEVYSY